MLKKSSYPAVLGIFVVLAAAIILVLVSTRMPASPRGVLTGITAASSATVQTNTPQPTQTFSATATSTPALTATQPAAPTLSPTHPSTAAPQTKIDLPKGPTLIYTGEENSMRIFWQWESSAKFQLDWGFDPSYASGSAVVQEYDAKNHLYAFSITDLQPDRLYFYRVVHKQEYASGSFRSAPSANASQLKFTSYGDTRSHPDLHDAVAAQILDLFAADPAYQTFNLMVGDWVSEGDSEKSWDKELFSPEWQHIRALLGSSAFLSAMGNHEGSGGLFLRYFPLPFAASRYGSFDYGPAHISIIDQYVDTSAQSAQITWLKHDLSTSNKAWKFVVLHEPGWSASGGHDNDPQVQTVIEPILEENHVDIVFAGHNHYYARALVNGVTHLTVGTGGAPLYAPQRGQPNILATYMGTGYTRFEIDGNTLNGWMIGADGLVKDNFTITH